MTILITGATGNVGRPLVNALVRAGAHVRAVSRDPAAANLPSDVEVVHDAIDGLHGATAAFLNSRALPDQLTEFVDAAKKAGVQRIVALSAINADDDDARQPSRFRGDRNREADQLAAGSGIPWVSLRPTIFASNFIGMWAGQLKAGDTVYGPYPDASMAPVADADVAAVAARCFLTDDSLGQRIPLTGPMAMTNEQLLDVVGKVLGRPLQYQEVPPPAFRERFQQIGFSAAFADAYLALLAASAETQAIVTDDVQRILGRPATAFAAWAANHADVFTEGK